MPTFLTALGVFGCLVWAGGVVDWIEASARPAVGGLAMIEAALVTGFGSLLAVAGIGLGAVLREMQRQRERTAAVEDKGPWG
jgi:uncharacterized membrane-anchored protein